MIAIVDDRSLHLLEFVDRKALPQGLARLSRMVGGQDRAGAQAHD